MKKKHLRLIVSKNSKNAKMVSIIGFFRKCREQFKCIITPKKQKIYILKDSLIKIYRDYEVSTGICDIPYYVRAELKISEIIQSNKIDYYFKIVEKIRKKSLG